MKSTSKRTIRNKLSTNSLFAINKQSSKRKQVNKKRNFNKKKLYKAFETEVKVDKSENIVVDVKSTNLEKFLNCPLCNGLIRNFNDLKIHLKEAHSVNEQLISNVLRKFDKNEVDIINNDESIDNNEIISLERYDRNVYKDELNSIINQLDLSDINEYNLLEFDFIVDNCKICNDKIEDNLVIHLNDKHDLSYKQTIEHNMCILCGQTLSSRKCFLEHQLNLHQIISFITLNKSFKVHNEKSIMNSMSKTNSFKLSNLNISAKMRDKVLTIKNLNKKHKIKSPTLGDSLSTKKSLYDNNDDNTKDKTLFSLATFAAEYINTKSEALCDPDAQPYQFATSLMMKLYRIDELYGHIVAIKVENELENSDPTRFLNYNDQQKPYIDEERLIFIREIVFTRYEPSDKVECWSRCIRSMSNKVYNLKSRTYTHEEIDEFNKEREFIYKLVSTKSNTPEMKQLLIDYITSMNPDINPNDTKTFNYLDKTELKRLFDSCETAHHFATALMMKLFKPEELDASANVLGRLFRNHSIAPTKKALDPKRIAYIRLQTFKHFLTNDKKACWARCVKTMNEKIRNSQRGSLNHQRIFRHVNAPLANEYYKNNDINNESIVNDTPKEIDLDSIDVDRVFEETKSAANFCVQLMLKVFKKCELNNRNVYGRIFNPQTGKKDALNVQRVEFIRDNMLKYYPTNEPKKVWARCVKSMNDKICYLQKTNRLSFDSQANQSSTSNISINEMNDTIEAIKIDTDNYINNINDDNNNESLDVEDENNSKINYKDVLTPEVINYLYKSTISPQNFSVRLMLKCFELNELSNDTNVYGRVFKRSIGQKHALDENRIDFIRDIVFQYYPDEIKRVCWPKCIKSMNDKIRYLNGKR